MNFRDTFLYFCQYLRCRMQLIVLNWKWHGETSECAATQMPSCHLKVCTDLFTWSSTSLVLHLTNHCREHQMWTFPRRWENNKLFISNRLQDICAKHQPLLWSANYDLMSKAHLNQAHKSTIEIPKSPLGTRKNNYYSINYNLW